MGWSDGQGLGAQKQGITEHIKVRVKHDSKGKLGCECHGQNRLW